jgi:hypothetical protein
MATVEKKQRRSLGDILVEQGVITPLELDEALQRQRLTGDFLGRVLVKLELCQEQDVLGQKRAQDPIRRIGIVEASERRDLIRREPRPGLWHEQAAVRGKCCQKRTLEGERRRLTARGYELQDGPLAGKRGLFG